MSKTDRIESYIMSKAQTCRRRKNVAFMNMMTQVFAGIYSVAPYYIQYGD